MTMTTTMGQDESNGTSAPQGIGCPIDTADAVATPCRRSAGHRGEGQGDPPRVPPVTIIFDHPPEEVTERRLSLPIGT